MFLVFLTEQGIWHPHAKFPREHPHAKFPREFYISMQISLENLASPCKNSLAFTRITFVVEPLCKNTIQKSLETFIAVRLLLEIALDPHTRGFLSAM